MLKPVFENPWVRAGALLGALVGLAFVIHLLSGVLIPLFFAFIVAYMFHPIIKGLEKRRFTRMAAIILLVLALIAASLSMPLMILPGVISEGQRLVHTTSADLENARFDRIINRLPLETLVRELGWAPPEAKDVNARVILVQHLGDWVEKNAVEFLRSHVPEIAKAGKSAGVSAAALFGALTESFFGFVLFVGNFAVFAFVAIYLLKDYESIVQSAHELLPPRHRGRITDLMIQIDIQLRAYLRGQISVCACFAVMYCIGFLLSGVPFALPLGLFGGIASFVPYMGITLTALPAGLLILLRYGLDGHIVGLVLTFVIAQGLEGYVLTPKLVGSQVGLSPVWVVLAIMVFSTAFGFVGLLLAVPMAAILKVLVGEALTYYRKSSLFQEALPRGSDS